MADTSPRTLCLVGAGDQRAFEGYCRWQRINPDEAVFVQVQGDAGTAGRLSSLPASGCTFKIYNYEHMDEKVRELLRQRIGYTETLFNRGVHAISR